MEHNIMNIKKLNLTVITLSTLLLITISSLAYAVLTDSVDSLKTCGEGKTYSEYTAACDGVCATNSSGEIINLVKNADKELIKLVKIFDIYQGSNIEAGKKSIAFNVTFEPKDKTLSEEDIEQASKKIISVVQKITGATLRS